jgi:GrpB-like predicted nucleotidyltransferase (UPF0157 family)
MGKEERTMLRKLDEYATLKQSLAEKHRHDISAYVDGKHEFIIRIVKTALNQRNNTI